VKTAEILCLGNELLIGRTVNKNSTDIALALTKNGVYVNRSTTVRDDIKAGVSILTEIYQRQPDVLCITGGLGPTHDDIQLDIVAQSLGKELVLNQEALDQMLERYGGDESRINATRRKMAMLPQGSIPLKNREGSAPGVYTKYDNIHIFSMPGVPREMLSILEWEIIPLLRNIFSLDASMVEYGFDVRGVPEADIADITERLQDELSPVNFKSHPKKDETGYWLSLQTYLITNDDHIVRDAAKKWKEDLVVKYPHIKTSEIKPVFSKDFIPE
jgi:molybdopterin-biosynthesis enzyme MoeA-like protein